MEILKKILIVLIIILAITLIVAIALPNQYKVERTIVIDAPPSAVYPLVAELENWNVWSPWADMDPEAKHTYTGVSGQPGSSWKWDGEILGSGAMTHTELEPNKAVKSTLEFYSPQQMRSDEMWTFESVNGSTKVTWSDYGDLDYPVGRYFGLFIDDMMGDDFEQGLQNLKKMAEAGKPVIQDTTFIKDSLETIDTTNIPESVEID